MNKWLTYKVLEGRGAVTFSLTDGGDVGVFIGEEQFPRGTGSDAASAVAAAAFKEWNSPK